MTISVIIPAYNSQATIGPALESVFAQTTPPNEIVVVNDGSTDDTALLLRSYASRLTIVDQPNAGVARARNRACQMVRGDLVAFLDSDDLWHPRYLEFQLKQVQRHPEAVAYFAGHINIPEFEDHSWTDRHPQDWPSSVLSSVDFLRNYNAAPGPFACITHCCVPRKFLAGLGDAPFCESVSAAEDMYFFNRLALLGSVVYSVAPLTAYRVRAKSLSSDRRRVNEDEVRAFELLRAHFPAELNSEVRRVYRTSLAMKRRLWAKTLISAGEYKRARYQLVQSVQDCSNVVSIAKSGGLLLLSYLPGSLRPTLGRHTRVCDFGQQHS
jgi:glycosyltransferase involved in cell wall biosynthesis